MKIVKARQQHRTATVYWYECGEFTDEYTDSAVGDAHECMCGVMVEVVR